MSTKIDFPYHLVRASILHFWHFEYQIHNYIQQTNLFKIIKSSLKLYSKQMTFLATQHFIKQVHLHLNYLARFTNYNQNYLQCS